MQYHVPNSLGNTLCQSVRSFTVYNAQDSPSVRRSLENARVWILHFFLIRVSTWCIRTLNYRIILFNPPLEIATLRLNTFRQDFL